MDRQWTYPGEIITDLKLLLMQRNAEVGIGHLTRAVLGTGPTVSGLACNPTSPASMSVTIGTGSIYTLEPFEATAMGSLSADTTDTLVKQGINATAQTFACAAPTTAGESIVYLIEAAYQDYDTNDQALAFFNSTNPQQPYTGPNGNGESQPTVRQGLCSVQLVAGVAATTGSQTAPATSSGYTGLYTITVPFGATTITTANIATAASAPFIQYTLPQLATLFASITPGFANIQEFTSSGTFTVPAGISRCKVRVWGPGGGSGSSGATGNGSPGGGGGGGYSERIVTGLTAGTAIAVSIGAGGIAGASGGAGGTGGTSSFGSYLSATGGAGGQNNASGNAGAGGTGFGGSLNLTGATGSTGSSGSIAVGGSGGGSPFGISGTGGALGISSAGLIPGGGAGAAGTAIAGQGYTGGNGLVIVEW